MNFLAHSLIPELAEPGQPELIAGGFLGDFIKGRVPDDMPKGLALGVRLHRRIDAYSNGQAEIRRSCARFPAELRRFAPIFVDVIADHLLARRWSSFHQRPLPEFTADVYQAIAQHAPRLPESGQRFFDYMATEDLLAGYRDRDVMMRSLRAVTRRLRRTRLEDHLAESLTETLLEALDDDFVVYFPDLVSHSRTWLQKGRDTRPTGLNAEQ